MHNYTAPLVLCIGIISAAATAGERPRIINMGVLPGDTSSTALAVTPDGAAAVGQSGYMAFRWAAQSGMGSLGAPQATFGNSNARGITDDGMIVVGHSRDYSTHHPCELPLRWTVGGLEVMTPQLTHGAAITAISSDGQVLGGHRWTCVFGSTIAYIWTEAGGVQDLVGTVPASRGVRAVSGDASVVVGGGGPLGYFAREAWRWTAAGGVEDLPRLPNAIGCGANAVTRDGAIIGGTCAYESGAAHRPFKWNATLGTQPLPFWPGWSEVSVLGLSDGASLIVGLASHQGNSIAIAWDDGNLVDLNNWLPERGVNLAGWMLQSANAVNPAGDVIVGHGLYSGEQRAFIVYLGCYANCDGSTVEPTLTIDDFTCFINEFAHAQLLPPEEQITHYANCDHSTTPPILTVDDFTCFIDAFAQGCP